MGLFFVFVFFYSLFLIQTLFRYKRIPIYIIDDKNNTHDNKLQKERPNKMRHINKANKQLIIKKQVQTNSTKIKDKNGKVKKTDIKYTCDIPNEVLIFLLEKYKAYDADAETPAEYINNMLSSEKFYLCFMDHSNIYISNVKNDANSIASMAIYKNNAKSSIYSFTLSKKVFKFLKENPKDKLYLSYVINFDNLDVFLENPIIDIELA